MAVSYDSPTAMWAGILGTLALSVIGVQKGTAERFTAPEGAELTRQVRVLEKAINAVEHEVDVAEIHMALSVHEAQEARARRAEDKNAHISVHRRDREEVNRIREFLVLRYGDDFKTNLKK
jgi:hypothetical protein